VAIASRTSAPASIRGDLCVCVVDEEEERFPPPPPDLRSRRGRRHFYDAEMRRGRLAILEKAADAGAPDAGHAGEDQQYASGSRKAGHDGFRNRRGKEWALDGASLKALASSRRGLNLNRVWVTLCLRRSMSIRWRVSPETLREMIIRAPPSWSS